MEGFGGMNASGKNNPKARSCRQDKVQHDLNVANDFCSKAKRLVNE